MHSDVAIHLDRVSKVYRLHGSQADQLIDVLGLSRFGIRPKTPPREFSALCDVSLTVPRGQRVGIVGRNGAGKTTLLKLISGNFAPTVGTVEVHGVVQALMSVGLGFHPEYTGRQNVEASLQYSGLARADYQQAIEGIIEFCELGDFLDQPFKTYSLGMQARLMFAAATAIRPDILIVDEVLGAGDAYFVAKSRKRVEDLISSGCTMLLVSHSMQQVLELCHEAIWLDGGRIRMQGPAFDVVKAYEGYMHGGDAAATRVEDAVREPKDTTTLSEEANGVHPVRSRGLPAHVRLQHPHFLPHELEPELADHIPQELAFQAPGGISRWAAGEHRLKVTGFTTITERGITNRLVSLRPAKFRLRLLVERGGAIRCRYGFAIDDMFGTSVAKIFSPVDEFEAVDGEERVVDLLLNPCQLGKGQFTIGVSVLGDEPIEHLNVARRFDLLSRSFVITVDLPDSLSAIDALLLHSGEWSFRPTVEAKNDHLK